MRQNKGIASPEEIRQHFLILEEVAELIAEYPVMQDLINRGFKFSDKYPVVGGENTSMALGKEEVLFTLREGCVYAAAGVRDDYGVHFGTPVQLIPEKSDIQAFTFSYEQKNGTRVPLHLAA